VALSWHRKLEANAVAFFILAFLAVTVGGRCSGPTLLPGGHDRAVAGLAPYTALELEGRDIYVREGCNTCHSQQVRPFKSETDRYGAYSRR
jgi:cbb3-type cytochrome c oxidase subunit II